MTLGAPILDDKGLRSSQSQEMCLLKTRRYLSLEVEQCHPRGSLWREPQGPSRVFRSALFSRGYRFRPRAAHVVTRGRLRNGTRCRVRSEKNPVLIVCYGRSRGQRGSMRRMLLSMPVALVPAWWRARRASVGLSGSSRRLGEEPHVRSGWFRATWAGGSCQIPAPWRRGGATARYRLVFRSPSA